MELIEFIKELGILKYRKDLREGRRLFDVINGENGLDIGLLIVLKNGLVEEVIVINLNYVSIMESKVCDESVVGLSDYFK